MRIVAKTLLPVFCLLVLAVFATSCAGLRSRYHEVSAGETLNQIASRYEVPVAALKRYNNSALSEGLVSGAKLYIPFEENPKWDGYVEEASTPLHANNVRELNAVHFSWPVPGAISSPFGRRRNERHEGIDIVAKRGTVVRASRSGHVIYSSNQISGYGNMIIVKHSDSFSTVYAHLSKFDAKKGQFVTRGQKVGRVGKTGRATGYHLHFEIRNDRIAVNPLLYLQGQYANNTIR